MVKQGPVARIDRNFWFVTLLLAVLSAAAVYYWATVSVSAWLPAASDTATDVDHLFRFLAASGSALMIYVVGYIIYFAIAFRRRAGDPPDAIGVQIHDNHNLEFWWTLIPALFVVLLSIISVQIWFGVQLRPNNGLVVESIGHQWYFSFRAPGVNGEIPNELHIPLNQPVTIDVTSADVIHSFWVPELRIKADMVPGLVNTIKFTPTRLGRYRIICAEFCGTEHGEMDRQYLVIESPEKFQTWRKSWQVKNAGLSDALPKPGGGTVDLSKGVAGVGQALFAQKCSACHAIAPFSHRIVGPGLKGVLDDPAHPNLVNGDRATPGNIAEILQTGYRGSLGAMPTQTQNGLSNSDIANLVAYLTTLN